MIHIEFAEPQDGPWKRWRRTCERRQQAHNGAIEAGESSNVTDLYKSRKATVYAKPDGPFHGKCAYCEQGITKPLNQPGDVEHFRPKGGVTNEDDTPVTISPGGAEHPGYYWRAYDWRNLLLACSACNTRQKYPNTGEKIGKGTIFPVRGDRAWRPDEEDREEPLLLHPVWDEPSDHLHMDSTGVLYWGDSGKGEATVKLLGLNLRGLPKDRRDRYEEIKRKCASLLHIREDSDEANRIRDEIRQARDGVGEYTIAVRKAIEDAIAEMTDLTSSGTRQQSPTSDS